MLKQAGAVLVEQKDYDGLAARVAKLEGSGTPGPGPGPAPTGTILKMPLVANPGDPVTLGSGPDQIVLLLSNGPGATQQCSFALLLDGVVIAAPLTVSASTGMTGGQLFTINGTWGPGPHKIGFVPAGTGGLDGLWINRVTYNFVPLVYNGPTVDARGALSSPNAETLWDNIGASVTFGAPIAVAPPPPPPVPPAGSVPVDRIVALIAAAKSGDTIVIPPGTYSGSILVDKAVTLDGQNKVTFDGTGLPGSALRRQKGGIVPVADVTLQNFKMTAFGLLQSGADLTCAIRPDTGCTKLTLRGLELYGNQCALGSGGVPMDLVIDSCKFHHNGLSGAGNGYAHNVYLGGIGNLTVTNTDSLSPVGGHAWKVRGVTGVFSLSGGNHSAADATIVDIPDGSGKPFTIVGATLLKGADDANHGVLGYAMEGVSAGIAGGSVSSCTFNLACANPTISSNGGPIVFASNTWSGGNKATAAGSAAAQIKGLP